MARSTKIKQGDNGTKLKFTLMKPDKTPWNLTGAAVSATFASKRTRFVKSCSIISASEGKCECVLLESDTSKPGKYRIQVTMKFGASVFTTTTLAEIQIMEGI